jgi:hypothetical protein
MVFISKYFSALSFLFLSLGFITQSHAHMMIAQHGTINVLENGAYMVLSLPISAFDNVDDDKDGKLSMDEFNRHGGTINESILKNITLMDKTTPRSLLDIRLSPVTPHDSPKAGASQLVVMGKFELDDMKNTLQFQVNLYAKDLDDQTLTITASRNSDDQKHIFILTPKQPVKTLFPDAQK